MQPSAISTTFGMARSPAIQRRTVRPSTPSWRAASCCDQPSAAMAAMKSAGGTDDAVSVNREAASGQSLNRVVTVKAPGVQQRAIRAKRGKAIIAAAGAQEANGIGRKAGGAAGGGFVVAHGLSPVDAMTIGPMVLVSQQEIGSQVVFLQCRQNAHRSPHRPVTGAVGVGVAAGALGRSETRFPAAQSVASNARGGLARKQHMGCVMKTFEEWVDDISGGVPPVLGTPKPPAWDFSVVMALRALAAERAAAKSGEAMGFAEFSSRVLAPANRHAEAEREAKRSAALDKLARNDADEITGSYRVTAKLGDGGAFTLGDAVNIVAPVWNLAEINRLPAFVKPDPRSYSHWGMHA